MIIQNGQNRNLAICNARQVAMLRGGQWIIEPYVLSSAVKSQIYEDIVTTGHHSASLAAEVWRAANLYCKSHAASHPELTAQGKLLSAFVNADKDMYCSLPLALTPEAQSALPTRWLVGGSGKYFKTGLKLGSDSKSILRFKFNSVSNNITPLGARAGNIEHIHYSSTFYYEYNGSWNSASTSAVANTLYEVETSLADGNQYIKINGVVKKTTAVTGTRTTNYDTYIFASNNGSSAFGICNASLIDCMLQESNGTEHLYLPSKISNLMELLDLETLTLATRVGTFTEQKTIPNS